MSNLEPYFTYVFLISLKPLKVNQHINNLEYIPQMNQKKTWPIKKNKPANYAAPIYFYDQRLISIGVRQNFDMILSWMPNLNYLPWRSSVWLPSHLSWQLREYFDSDPVAMRIVTRIFSWWKNLREFSSMMLTTLEFYWTIEWFVIIF